MSYLVLARKWRPQTFEDVAGQEVIVKTLRQALKSQRIAHAFLFCGSRGTGKTSLARILAKALCCQTGISPDPCGKCSICLSIADGSSLDIVEIDGASNTGVDDVRELKETIRYQPSHARFKIFIIDEVHMLSTNAFNALLKTLEEPPEHVKFILATTESHKIPVTILSRCQRYDFRRLKVSIILEQLNHILENEGLAIEQEGLRLIAQVADGGMRDALSLTDQVLSFAPTYATLADVSSLLGVTSRKTSMDMSLALLNRDFQTAFQLIDEVDVNGVDLRKFADDVATEIRHLAVSKATKTIRGLVDLSDDEITHIDSVAKQFDLHDLQRVFTSMLEGIDQIARSQQTRMSLELVCLRIADRPSSEDLVSISKAISRLESLSQRHAKGQLTAPKSMSPPPLTTEVGITREALPQTPTIQKTERPDSQKKEPIGPSHVSALVKWREFVAAIGAVNQSIGVYLEHGKPQDDLVVAFEHRFYRDRVLEVYKEAWFQNIVERIYGKGASISWTFEEDVSTDSISIQEAREMEQKRAQALIEKSARNHPVVKKALALFGGEIKAVKAATPLKGPQEGASDENL